jgi:hypothetical protein
MFIRGGIDSTVVRPICQNDVDAETSQCALSIQVSPNYKDYKSKFSKITWFDVTFFSKDELFRQWFTLGIIRCLESG